MGDTATLLQPAPPLDGEGSLTTTTGTTGMIPNTAAAPQSSTAMTSTSTIAAMTTATPTTASIENNLEGSSATNNSDTNSSNNHNNPNPSRRVTIGHNTNHSHHTTGITGTLTGTGNTGSSFSMPPPGGLGSFALNNSFNLGGAGTGGFISGNSASAAGGGANNTMAASVSAGFDHRRGSMGSSFGNLDDMFGRRPSFGFDMGMDTFFGRRDSTDSSTAALDLAIMEMSRRRYSTAMGGMGTGGGGPMGVGVATPSMGASMLNHSHHSHDTSLYPPSQSASVSAAASSSLPPPLGGTGASMSQSSAGGTASQASSSNLQPSTNDSISQRQQQLQQQQRDLEQRQRELEFQRQQLIASMQERSYGPGGSGGGSGSMMHRGSFGGGMGGSLGLGSVHSQGSGGSQQYQYQYNHPYQTPHSQNALPSLMPQQPPFSYQTSHHEQLHHHPTPSSHASSNHMSGGASIAGSIGSSQHAGAASALGGGSRNWWICQVCNSKAFASQEEAMSHESICQDGPATTMGRGGGMGGGHSGARAGHRDSLSFLHHDVMGRNFSMGLGSGMDSSHRGMSLALGTMDNSARGIVSMGMDSSRGGGSMGFDSSRNMSLGLDSSSGHSYRNERGISVGPFAMLSQPIPLAMPSDKDWLTPLHCFVRGQCVEVFTATEEDVATPSKGKRKPIQVGQIGIRCPHCRINDAGDGTNRARERGSVYYPTSISSIYNATMNLLQRHLHNCPAVPDEIMRRYETLKADDARSGTSKRYWIESALSLGLVDTSNGIRHSALRPPPLPTLTHQQETTGLDVARRHSNEFFGNKSNAVGAENEDDPRNAGSKHGEEDTDDIATAAGGATSSNSINEDALLKAEREMTSMSPLVTMDEKLYATKFSFHLMGQMQPCVFTEADRLGKRKGLPPGFPGLACRHCFGGYGSGRFFPSSIKTLSDTSKTLNVLHNHMMRCRKCPSDIKENLEKLRGSHDEERAKMKFGSQKAFFCRIWGRLHGNSGSPGLMSPMSDPHSPQLSKRALARAQDQGFPVIPQLYHQGHQDIAPNQANRQASTTEGLEALAAASNPKRQKI